MRGALRCLATALPVVGLLWAGCIHTEKAYPIKRQYVLDVTRNSPTPASPEAKSVKVRRFLVSSRFEGGELVYRTSDVTYESDFYNEFFTHPALMITEEVRRWLDASGVFGHVVDAATSIEAAYRLEGVVSSLHGDYRDRNAPRAVLEVQFLLVDAAGPKESVVFRKTYTAVSPVASRGPAELVGGLGASLAQVLTAFEQDLREALR
jgi:cholesterol transport system auxiliary component